MEIVETTKFMVGLAFVLVGAVMLWGGPGARGFGQTRQAGVLAAGGGCLFLAAGFGWIDF